MWNQDLLSVFEVPTNIKTGTCDNFVILHLKKLTYVFRTLTCMNYIYVVTQLSSYVYLLMSLVK